MKPCVSITCNQTVATITTNLSNAIEVIPYKFFSSPQIVIPTNHQAQAAAAAAAIMPTAQPLLLNQMPMLTPGVQFILRPQATAKIQPQVQTAGPGLIIQPTSGQQLLQIQPQPARSQQPMVRVLTNGMQLQPATTTTYVTQVSRNDV